MMAEGKTRAESPSAEPLQPAKSTPTGFALLARRISSWTTRFVLSAMILVAGLAFGRQVLDWWADDAAPTAQPPQVSMTDRLGDPAEPHEIQFGEAAWTVVRETVVGTREEASAALRARCRATTASSALPDDPPHPAESRLLASLAAGNPVAQGAVQDDVGDCPDFRAAKMGLSPSTANGPPKEGPQATGQWSVYELEEGFPMVAGVRSEATAAAGPPGSPVAVGPRRVVTWGLAAPTAERTWTLYTFRARGETGGPLTDLPEVPLPPNSRKTMAMRVSGGGAVVAFKGPSQTGSWRGFFDRALEEQGWTAAGTWQQTGSTWHRRYVRSDDSATLTADVRFGPDGRGQTTGLLMIAPPQTQSAESERS